MTFNLVNPYLDEYERVLLAPVPDAYADFDPDPEFGRQCYLRSVRETVVGRYAWAIPNVRAVETLVALGPLVEIGAGTGYWAYLVTQAGGDVVAYDECPPGVRVKNRWCDAVTWHPVHKGGADSSAAYPDRALFLCWPPYAQPMASSCLEGFTGNTLAYVGEREGGCTGDRSFFDMLRRAWVPIERVALPQWPSIYDELVIYERALPR